MNAGPAVGFIGAGRMGLPMVQRLRAAGMPVVAVARRRELVDQVRAIGVTVVDTPADVGRACAVLIECVFDDRQVEEVLLGEHGALGVMAAGSTVVLHTTGSPRLAERLQAAAPEGVTVLDVPVSGPASDIVAGHITLLAGGPAAALDMARPALATYGHPILHLGVLGDGQRVKLLNNLQFAVNVRLARDLYRMAADLGVDAAAALSAVGESSGRSFGLQMAATDPEHIFERLREFLDKDVATVEAMASEHGGERGRLGEIAPWWRNGDRKSTPPESPRS
ncbi:MAG: NAD(P)-dependent oxidoreductase, partial [Ilumatobacteraceae bacterium]